MGRKKLDKQKLLEAFKADLVSAEPLKSEIDAKVKSRRETFLGNLYGNEQDGKSKIVVKSARRTSAWAHASIKDPFVSTTKIVKCNPVTFEDGPINRQTEKVLNTQFCREFDRYNHLTKGIKVLDVDATLFIQVGWETVDEDVEVERDVVAVDENGMEYVTKAIVKEKRVLINRPTAKILRGEDVYIDPTAQDDIDNAQFIIYRYESDYTTLKKDGRYSNLDKIEYKDVNSGEDGDYVEEDQSSFKFADKPRQKVLVYEYWGNYDLNGDGMAEPMVCSWIGNTVIRLSENPLPDKKPPFIVVPFSSVPFQMHGENNIDLIADQQQVITALTRGFINNIAQSTNGQVGLKKGTLDPTQRKKFFAGKNFEYNTTTNDIWQGHYNQIPGSAFDMLAMQNNEVESMTGIKSFSGGINTQGIGNGSAASANGVLDATSTRRLDLVRNISENWIKPLLRKWIAYNNAYLRDEDIFRMTNEEVVRVDGTDVTGVIDIDITISTAEDNANKSRELSFLLQTLGNSVPFELTQKVLAQIAKLSNQPELEKDILEFKPEPDPMEQKIKELEVKKLEMELAKLAAETESIRSAGKEDLADEQEKMAQARLKNAQADRMIADTQKIASQKDLLDLEYVTKDEQVADKVKREELLLKHEQELAKEEYKRRVNLEAMAYQAANADRNIGVIQ